MNEAIPLLLKANLRHLKLPTMLAEYEKLAREAATGNEPYDGYLLRLTELEVAARAANAVAGRIRAAGFPVLKEFDTFDFTATPALPRQKVLELARGEWIEQRFNCCLIGGSGTGKTHVATALGLALCRLGKRIGVFQPQLQRPLRNPLQYLSGTNLQLSSTRRVIFQAGTSHKERPQRRQPH